MDWKISWSINCWNILVDLFLVWFFCNPDDQYLLICYGKNMAVIDIDFPFEKGNVFMQTWIQTHCRQFCWGSGDSQWWLKGTPPSLLHTLQVQSMPVPDWKKHQEHHTKARVCPGHSTEIPDIRCAASLCIQKWGHPAVSRTEQFF